MAKGRPWSREELIVVFNLYCSMSFGQMDSRNPNIIEMARVLGRTPGSVAMKLVNFASFDPAHQARGVSGLKGASRADRTIWDEFHTNWERLAFESEQRLNELLAIGAEPVRPNGLPSLHRIQLPESMPDGPTDAMRTLRVRTVQGFFRKAVLAAYQGRCCVTGNPVPELLIASHILPWSEFPENRIDPSNGLCLAAHFDKAFDQGLISFDEDMRLVISREMKSYLPNDALVREFVPMERTELRMPEKFRPNEDFMRHHREKIFRA
jgi:putative restriction endonuclease